MKTLSTINRLALASALAALAVALFPLLALIWGHGKPLADYAWRVFGSAFSFFIVSVLALRTLTLFYSNRRSHKAVEGS